MIALEIKRSVVANLLVKMAEPVELAAAVNLFLSVFASRCDNRGCLSGLFLEIKQE